MKSRRSGTRAGTLGVPLAVAFALAGLVPLALAVVVIGMRTRTDADASNRAAATRLADTASAEIQRSFAEWRNELLVAAQDDALRQWYRDPASRHTLQHSIDAALVGLHTLYPDLIDEACYIDATGPEQARQVSGHAVVPAELSPDESGNPFFTPTLALPEGTVYQAAPYVSPDSNRWVVSNSTPIAVSGHAVAILHFETNLEALRLRIARSLPTGARARIVDDRVGVTILDTSKSVPTIDVKKPLNSQPLPRLTALQVGAGLTEADARLELGPTNANHWLVQVLSPAAPAFSAGLLVQLAVLVLCVLAILLAVAVAVTRWLVRPLRAVTRHAERLAIGDLTGVLEVKRGDEIGRLATALARATQQLAGTVTSIRGQSDALVTVAARMGEVSQELTDTAAKSSAESTDIAGTADTMGNSVTAIAGSMAELQQSADEIADRAGEAGRVAADGARIAGETTRLVQDLMTASATIDEVVTVIGSVTDQTRLLALNATIEAARAGEHGQGFAVVATEVKNLADETSQATDQIARRVESLRATASAAATAVDHISSTITRVDQAQEVISDVVRRQTMLARDMGQEVGGLSGTADAMAGSSERAVDVASAAGRTAAETTRAARDLDEVAQTVRRLVGGFTTP